VALAVAIYFWRRSVNKKKKAVEIGGPDIQTQPKDQMVSGSSTGSPTTRYGNSAIEDGSVMSGLANSTKWTRSNIGVHSYGGEIHEMDQSSRENFHELESPRGLHEMRGDDRRLGSPFSVEKP
jgi:hypothetical protein